MMYITLLCTNDQRLLVMTIPDINNMEDYTFKTVQSSKQREHIFRHALIQCKRYNVSLRFKSKDVKELAMLVNTFSLESSYLKNDIIQKISNPKDDDESWLFRISYASGKFRIFYSKHFPDISTSCNSLHNIELENYNPDEVVKCLDLGIDMKLTVPVYHNYEFLKHMLFGDGSFALNVIVDGNITQLIPDDPSTNDRCMLDICRSYKSKDTELKWIIERSKEGFVVNTFNFNGQTAEMITCCGILDHLLKSKNVTLSLI